MPRAARIDAPGALHHIIVRGIEQRKIFNDDIDRINFLDRLGKVLSETKTKCFAWALMLLISTIDIIEAVTYFRTATNLFSAKRTPIYWNLSGIFISIRFGPSWLQAFKSWTNTLFADTPLSWGKRKKCGKMMPTCC